MYFALWPKADVEQPAINVRFLGVKQTSKIGGVAMHGDGKQAPGEMPWIVPARKLQLLGFGHILSVGLSRIGIAAVGTNKANRSRKYGNAFRKQASRF
jgi:hypothetical protein